MPIPPKETFRTMVPVKAGEGTPPPTKIQILPLGVFDSPTHGQFSITSGDAQEYIDNFVNGGFRTDQLPIDLDHGPAYGGSSEAAGWITDLELRVTDPDPNANGVWASVDWTPLGVDKLTTRQYRFISPEFCPIYMDGLDGTMASNVLNGAGLVNRPLFRNMVPVVAHDAKAPEPDQTVPMTLYFTKHNAKDMDLTQLLTKDPAALTASEKEFMQANAKHMSADQIKKFGIKASEESDTAAAQAKTDAEIQAEAAAAAGTQPDPQAEQVEVVVDDASTTDESADDGAAASEPGTDPISASSDGKGGFVLTAAQHEAMKARLAAADEAIKASEAIKAGEEVKGWLFTNDQKGKFAPKAAGELTSFLTTLTASQKTAFRAIVAGMPNVRLFTESGSANAADSAGVKASEEFDKIVEGKLTAAIKAGEILAPVDAFKKAVAENPDLVKRMEDEKSAAMRA